MENYASLKFNNWHIAAKVLFLCLLPVIIVAAAMLAFGLPHATKMMYDGKRETLKACVDNAYSLLEDYHTRFLSGELSLTEAKMRAAGRLKSMRFGQDGYFLIIDTNLILVMHPFSPELVGKNVGNLRDLSGKAVNREISRLCRENGEGFVEYMWPKPATNQPVPKLVYARLFDEWGWMIGTGMYEDGIERVITADHRYVLSILLGVVLLAGGGGVWLARTIVKPIHGLTLHAEHIAAGNYDMEITIDSQDELGKLGASFSKMLRELKKTLASLRHVNRELESARDVAEDLARTLELQADELNRANQEVEEASRLKSEFLRNISHELRTPMNGILGMNELLLGTDLNDEQKEYALALQTSASEMMRLVTQVLDFSKLKNESGRVEEHEFHLATVIDECFQLFRHLSAEKKLSLTSRICDDVPATLVCEVRSFRQILINLLSNAIKFTEKGSIAVQASVVSETEKDLEVGLSVSDTGIGIPAELHEKIFEPFVQADGSTVRKHGGVGLGLAMAKRLANRLGGRIGVSSHRGGGSEFWFTVKLKLHGGYPESLHIPPVGPQ